MATMTNLFGEPVELPPEPTFKEEYERYIQSAAWKAKVRAAMERAGNKCERCGITKWSARLEGHHKTYERFRHEKLEDIEILCPKCHSGADEERAIRTELRSIRSRRDGPLWRGFDSWMAKAYRDKYWEDYVGLYEVERQAARFLEYISRFGDVDIDEDWLIETWET